MSDKVLKRLVAGTVAGMAGTALIMGMQEAGRKLAPQQMPPIRQHPGEFMVDKAGKLVPELAAKIPDETKKATAQLLGMGYGLSFPLLFAALRPKVREVIREGSVLGLVTWGAGYLGWLPATGLMPPITKQKPGQVIGAITSHLAYGIATAAAYRELRRRRWP